MCSGDEEHRSGGTTHPEDIALPHHGVLLDRPAERLPCYPGTTTVPHPAVPSVCTSPACSSMVSGQPPRLCSSGLPWVEVPLLPWSVFPCYSSSVRSP